jgi:hypothetical protein
MKASVFLSSMTTVVVLSLLIWGFWLQSHGISKWIWVITLLLQAHFAASYVAPTEPHLGVFNYIWPWVAGDRGLFGVHPNLPGIALAGIATLASLLAALAVLGIWVHHDWWRSLAMVGAGLEMVLMIGFLGPTKLLPIALDLAVLATIFMHWLPVKVEL